MKRKEGRQSQRWQMRMGIIIERKKGRKKKTHGSIRGVCNSTESACMTLSSSLSQPNTTTLFVLRSRSAKTARAGLVPPSCSLLGVSPSRHSDILLTSPFYILFVLFLHNTRLKTPFGQRQLLMNRASFSATRASSARSKGGPIR